MKQLFAILFLFTAGCHSRHPIDMGARFLTRPVALTVEVTSSLQDVSVEGRLAVDCTILEPDRFGGRILRLIVDGVSRDSEPLFESGSKLIIDCDEAAFDDMLRFGFSVWNIRDLHPMRVVRPNQ